ncbi:type III toxin-antitoxin system ToxN/AbiQ family toxin [Bacillus cereus]|uniref:type III toxin-antitoxin system ToxN/AbiQ family toxin n=1 Tax=Bacillus cereus TaxID=1396 RepID=UPI0020D26740|nr:type III toxin-antitoxin system ToxN/AbiQ family toxin [Bacillus cereus]
MSELDIKEILIKEPQYGRLLEKERQFIKKNVDNVHKKAHSVYTKVVDKKLPFFKNLCIDFKEMEKSHDSFVEQEMHRKRQAILKMRQQER